MRLFVLSVLLPVALSAADPVTAAFKARYQTQKLNFVESAEAMAEENMPFRLTPDQRAFGDWLEHTADMNYRMCSQIVGQPAPKNTGVNGVQNRGKQAIIEAIKGSFAHCDAMFESLNDAKAMEEVPAGNRKVVAVDVMFSYIANLNAHYGNMVGYMRVKGVIPPSTARTNRAKKK
jgi:hypothetical protein